MSDTTEAATASSVTPSRVCELKYDYDNKRTRQHVTPSRVCELKWKSSDKQNSAGSCHTLTGVWVEIWLRLLYNLFIKSHPHGCVSWNISDLIFTVNFGSHPHGCVSWNIKSASAVKNAKVSHPHGCVSWNYAVCRAYLNNVVTPSRVCELKLLLNNSLSS